MDIHPGIQFKWNDWILEVLAPAVNGMLPCKVVDGPHCPLGVWWNFEAEALANSQVEIYTNDL